MPWTETIMIVPTNPPVSAQTDTIFVFTVGSWIEWFTLVMQCTVLCQNGVYSNDWHRYKSKNTGRHDFQIDPSIVLLNHGICLD